MNSQLHAVGSRSISQRPGAACPFFWPLNHPRCMISVTVSMGDSGFLGYPVFGPVQTTILLSSDAFRTDGPVEEKVHSHTGLRVTRSDWGQVMSNLRVDLLVKALLDGDQAGALAEARRLRDGGVACEQIVTQGIEAAMGQLDAKCTVEQYNLLEIMLTGRAAMGVIKELYPESDLSRPTKGPIVIGTPEGDVHDLGKNVLKAVLVTGRYRVVDCGKDCPVRTMIDAAEREGARAILVSGLITTVIPQVRLLRNGLIERGLEHVEVIAGGAALKQASAESLNVDFVADTAFDGLHYLDGAEKVSDEQR